MKAIFETEVLVFSQITGLNEVLFEEYSCHTSLLDDCQTSYDRSLGAFCTYSSHNLSKVDVSVPKHQTFHKTASTSQLIYYNSDRSGLYISGAKAAKSNRLVVIPMSGMLQPIRIEQQKKIIMNDEKTFRITVGRHLGRVLG